MLKALMFIGLVIGVVMVALSFLTFKRKGEAEISKDVVKTPLFIVGALVTITCLIASILM